MKIAILSCFHPYRGGISQFNSCIFKELSRNNEVRAFNFSRQYPQFLFPGKTQLVTEKDNAVPVPSERCLDTANPFTYISTARKIREWAPDLFITRYWMSYFAPSLGYVARHLNSNAKRIAILDNVIPHEQHFFDRPLTKYYLNSYDAYVTLCSAVTKDLLDFKPDARYLQTPHPLYSQFGEKISREEAMDKLGIRNRNGRNLLFFGLIREYKGLDILLEAFGKLGNDYNLIIAGEPYGSFEKYQGIIDSLPNRENIYLNTEYIPDYEVTVYFSAADVCVLPYRSATQSGISSISYHFETPLITTDVGGLKELIGDAGTGLLARNPDPESVAETILKYFSSSDLRNSLISNIKAEKQKLSWETFCGKVLAFNNNL